MLPSREKVAGMSAADQDAEMRDPPDDGIADYDSTHHLIEESSNRAAHLQQLALEASSTLHHGSDSNYFIVSREYYSELFYGFTTNCAIPNLLETLREGLSQEEMDEVHTTDIVERFRETFSKSLKKAPVIKALTVSMNQAVESACTTIAVSADWSGNVLASKVFGQDLVVCDSPAPELMSAIEAIGKIDIIIIELAKTLSRLQAVSGDQAGGFYLVLQSNKKIEDPHPLRRPKLQLMQLGLVVNCRDEELWLKSNSLPRVLQVAMASSKVSAYSVLYERERYFAKAIRQATRGSVIKWGLNEQHLDFKTQVEALDGCNDPIKTHGAPVVLRRSESIEIGYVGDQNDKEKPLPWYEMVRYKMPSLDTLLTTTRGLRKFEVKSLARTTFSHLDQHFWKFTTQTIAVSQYQNISTKAAPFASFLMLQDTVEACMAQFTRKIEQWKRRAPIQSGKGKLDLPAREWLDGSSLSARIIEKREGDLSIEVEIQKDQPGLVFKVPSPGSTINELIASWIDDPVHDRVNLPKYFVEKCHGDPHFENILVDASIPEDPFIVTIDPDSADYDNPRFGDTSFVRFLDRESDRKEMLIKMAVQPMHDIAKLLLSTSGNYALIMKDGLSGGLNSDQSSSKYSLSWRTRSTTLPIGLDAGGVSGARVFFRSVSAVPQAKSYQYYFAVEVLEQFDAQMDALLSRSRVTSELHITIAKNTFLIQLWAAVVRHTFRISETLFPGQAEKSDQVLVFAIYLLEEGAKLLLSGSGCLRSKNTTDSLKNLLCLHDMMVEFHDK